MRAPDPLEPLLASDLHRCLALQRAVCAALPDPDQLAPVSERQLRAWLSGPPHLVLGLREGADLLALSVLAVPGQAADNLGRLVGLRGAALDRVAHLEITLVDLAARGRGLQRRCIEARIAFARAHSLGPVFATAAPDNHASLHHLRAAGLRVVRAEVELYGVARHLLRLDL
jgi:GNAT superfamily N-acetyltransferase